jgi:uncharacterized membrane protein
MEERMGLLLRWGVILAYSVILVGGAIYLKRHGHEHPAYAAFHDEPASLRSFRGILISARAMSGRGIIQLGCLIMIATPVARVLFAAWWFARERDWLYFAIGLTVFALLAWGLSS